MVVWLNDRPNYDKIHILFKKRTKNGVDEYSMTLSKALKDLVIAEKQTHLRLGYDSNSDDSYRLVVQLNDEEVGVPLLNEKGAVRLWFKITDYIEQYAKNGIILPMDEELKLTAKKNMLESDDIYKVDVSDNSTNE